MWFPAFCFFPVSPPAVRGQGIGALCRGDAECGAGWCARLSGAMSRILRGSSHLVSVKYIKIPILGW